MKPECAELLKQAAGRTPSKDELDAIEGRVLGALKAMAAENPAGFSAMSVQDRYREAAQRAKDAVVQDYVKAQEATVLEASRKAAVQAHVASIKPGLKGQMTGLYKLVADPWQGLESKADAISANFFRQLDGPAAGDKGSWGGLFQNKDFQQDVARAFYGEDASPDAQKAAKSFQAVMDGLVQRYQRAGLPISPREDYRVPQPQDPSLVAKATKDQWVEDHLNWVDGRKYVNPDGSTMSRDDLENMLRESYRSIATDGANKVAEGTGRSGSALVGGNKNAPRQLFFKDSASYNAAMAKYGRSTNLYELIQSHVRGMAKDIALAETFGRNADQTFTETLAKAFENDQTAAEGQDVEKLFATQRRVQRVYDAAVHPNRPGNETWSNLGVQLRGLLGSTQLGSLVGALPDLTSMKMAAELTGLPGIRMLTEFVKGLAPGEERSEFLRKTGLWMGGFQHAAMRSAIDDFRSGWGTWLNELTHKAMGLSAFDRGLRTANGMVVMDTLGKFTRNVADIGEADGDLKLLQKAGVTQDHWDTWRAAGVDKGPDGDHQLLTPQAIYNIPDADLYDRAAARVAGRSDVFKKAFDKYNALLADNPDNARANETVQAFHDRYDQLLAEEIQKLRDEAAEKLLQTAYGQMQIGARGASPNSASDKVAFGLDKLPAGTVTGELWRFMMQFKGVPLGIFRAHWEGMKDLDTWGSKASYMSRFVAYNAMMGALSVQLKALMNGQNPHNMNPSDPEGRKYWMEATASGGGFGLYGDLFLNGQTKMGSGAEVLAGPGIGAGYDLLKELAAAKEAATNGETNHNFTLAGVRWVRKNAVPLGNLWYTKAAFNRLIYDQLQDKLAPGSSAKQQRRMEQRGASYWWAPGTTTPQSAPDLSRAVR